MKIFDKLLSKRFVFIYGTVISAIITILYFVMNNISSYGVSIVNNISHSMLDITPYSYCYLIVTMFYILFILFILQVITTCGYYLKKNKNIFVLIEGIFCLVICIFFFLSIPAIQELLKLNGTPSIMDIVNVSTDSKVINASSNLELVFGFTMIKLVYNAILTIIGVTSLKTPLNFSFSEGETPSLNKPFVKEQEMLFDSYTGKPLPQASNLDNVKNSLTSVNGKRVILALLAIIIAFGGYKVYDEFFTRESINLAKNIEMEYEGIDGKGYAEVKRNNVEYTGNNDDVQYFLTTLTYKISKQKKLKNGEQIKVTVEYSKAQAKKLKLRITSDTKTIVVKGLGKRFEKASDIDTKVVDATINVVEDECKDEYKNSEHVTYNYKFDSVYFSKTREKDGTDYLIVVYRVERNTKQSDNTVEEMIYYDGFYLEDISTNSYDELKSWSPPYLKNRQLWVNSSQSVKNSSQVLEGLKNQDYTSIYTKIK